MEEARYTPKQVAELLHIPVKTLHEMCRNGEIEFIEVRPRKRLFKREHIEEFENRQLRRVKKRVDQSSTYPLRSAPKKGGGQESFSESRADLRKEMNEWP